ncbi:hypothetical protein D5F01_LYC19150 [Larimichthys crocea]|uniref:LINE-1 type transposase domain-containing protein 1 n=1 Tax=Larimichthys crocea TaxID=215358 RepID=A0A6G0HRQ6_LARCR|nr:hypothetical protein D5F01_LYC19150 [Larimichthys crocea]
MTTRMNKNAEQDTKKELDMGDGGTQNGARGAEADPASLTLDSIRTIMGEVMCTGMSALKAEVKEGLVGLRSNVRTDMKRQMGELASEINQKLQEVSGEIQGAVKRLSEVEDRVTDIERFDVGVKDALSQLMKSHQVMQNKITDLEGRSRCNNIRIYGVPENTEGPSVAKMVENLIKTELGEKQLGY